MVPLIISTMMEKLSDFTV